ncbi:MAG: aryl-sulfate sulfotransferase [Flavobacteriaceae bacterium]|nr:aryl-sulfate sulfotransferase [Flavobacteriaceae bacterium]
MRSKHYITLFIFSFSFSISTSSQNTVGVLLNTANSLNGYVLFTVHKDTYLINNCGEVINQWTSSYSSGKSVYLLENGNLLRAAQIPNPGNIAIPGIGGRIELFDWDGNLIWEYEYSTSNVTQHHDIFPMPNGNVLILAATILTDTEALQMGRNPANLTGTELYNEQIVELEPLGSNDAIIVWQWDIKDHLIQDFDNTKDNFGVVNANPQLLDINYLGFSGGGANWLHANSMQYNAQLDQIILSTRFLNEFYIIDHSTTTAEAATSSGGTYGKGGDFLYRWGNPLSYGQGTIVDQKLFGQHHPHWIGEGLIDAGKILIYNNGLNRSPSFSEINILIPPTSSPGVYTYTTNTFYGPLYPYYIYTTPVNTDFYSPILSSAQRLPNGNTLICEGTSGRFFEIDTGENIVWEYISPIGSAEILNQGDDPQSINNSVFRAKKYASNYTAFNGKNLTPGSTIESGENMSGCTILSITDNIFSNISIYPNPIKNILFINARISITKIEVHDLLGRLVKKSKNQDQINLSDLKSGLYILKLYVDGKSITKRIIKL